ncbi:MAG: PQQ-binding-like beta-propeller repeat protein [Kiritimatiellia bacterium]
MSYKPDKKLKWQMLLLLPTAALLAAVCGILVIIDLFAQRNVNLAVRTQRASPAPRADRLARASLQPWRRIWTCPAGAALTAAPAAWSNGWMATTKNGCVTALDDQGRRLWQVSFTNVYFVGSPVVAGSNVVAAGSDGDVLAMDAASGKRRWQVKLDASFLHGPLVMRHGNTWQVAMLSAGSGELFVLELQTGQLIWQSRPTNESDGQAGFDGQHLAYGNCDAAMHVFNSTTGEKRAQIPVGAGVTNRESLSDAPSGVMAGGVLVRDGRIYGGTGGGELVCVDVAGSQTVWRARVSESEAFNTPVSYGQNVLMSTRQGDVLSFKARSGELRWQVSLRDVIKSLCVVDDAVFVVAGGSLVGLRATDGGVFVKAAIGDNVEGPSWNGRVLVVADDGGNVIGFRGE